MKTHAIIQARLGSTRLPAKVLLPLPTGRSVLQEVIYRVAMIGGIDKIIVAVPKDWGGDVIADHLRGIGGIVVVGGPEADVLARFHLVATLAPADAYMRITADCPLLNPVVCGELLRQFWARGTDYASNAWPARTYPHGWDCEVFTRETLLETAACAVSEYDREHVTPWMQGNVGFRRYSLESSEDQSHVRVTLDTIDDYRVIVQELQRQAPTHRHDAPRGSFPVRPAGGTEA